MTSQNHYNQNSAATAPSRSRRMANYMLDVAKATMVVAGVGLTALEGAELAFIGGTNALYCRTAEQRAQSEHMCSVLGGARRDMSRGAAAIREHGVAGLVTPPTNWSERTNVPSDFRYVQQPSSQTIIPVNSSQGTLSDTSSVSLDGLLRSDSVYVARGDSIYKR